MKKIWIVCLMVLLGALLVGWGKKPVDLADNNGQNKLIDLQKAIKIASPGSDSTHATQGNKEGEGEQGSSGAVNPEQYTKTVTIAVQGTGVLYNGTELSLENLSMKVRTEQVKTTKFVLMDNFADAGTYRKALGILKKLQKDVGIYYTCE